MALMDMTVLVRKIGILFAGFVAANAAVSGAPAWQAIGLLAAGYAVINFILCRIHTIPKLAVFFVNLGLCTGFTVYGAEYSSILYHILLITAVLGTDRIGTKRSAVAILLTYLATVAYTAAGLTIFRIMNAAFNVIGFYVLTYVAVHVQFLIEKKASNDKQMKDLINQSNQHYRMALTDGLTGLYNYRAYKEKIDSIPQYVILIIDIDHFKRLNDTYGHTLGDKVLIKLGNIIKLSIRQGDFAFRYGGEEFVILLPGAVPQLGLKIAERLRTRVAQSEFTFGNTRVPVTVSIGLAVKPPSVSSNTAFEQADKALYAAKQQGRNNVQCYDGKFDDVCYTING